MMAWMSISCHCSESEPQVLLRASWISSMTSLATDSSYLVISRLIWLATRGHCFSSAMLGWSMVCSALKNCLLVSNWLRTLSGCSRTHDMYHGGRITSWPVTMLGRTKGLPSLECYHRREYLVIIVQCGSNAPYPLVAIP